MGRGVAGSAAGAGVVGVVGCCEQYKFQCFRTERAHFTQNSTQGGTSRVVGVIALITTIRLGASPDRGIIGTERRAMLNTEPRGFLYRVVAVVAGFTIVGFGLAPILKRGDLFSTNWFGELVFAPLAILLGLVVVAFALFKPEWLAVERVERKSRQ